MAKTLNKKQRMAIELLTSGRGMTYKEIAAEVGVNPKTLWDWRNLPEYTHFQEELQRINDARWDATVDAARDAAIRLCKEGKADFVKFVLQNVGYNPTQKVDVEADVKSQVVIIDDMSDEGNGN